MEFLQKASIKDKLIFIVLVVASLVIIIVSVIESIWDKKYFKNDLFNTSVIQSKIVAKYCAIPIIFKSKKDVNEVLEKLSNSPEIIFAKVLNSDGEIYGLYKKTNTNFVMPEEEKIHFDKFSKGKLFLKTSIEHQNKQVGSLLTVISTELLNKKIWANILRLAVIMVGLLIISYLLALWFQRFISHPIIKLSKLTRQISEKEDYSVRAHHEGSDEIAGLYLQFNKMLDQIQLREKEQKIAEKNLELMVDAERKKTEELEAAYKNLNQSSKATINLLEDLKIEIEERELVEKALRESEANITSLFKAAPIGIGLVLNRVIQRVNDKFCEMLTYSREELIGQDARMIYPTQEDYEWVGKEKYRQIADYGIGTVETRFKTKDGKIIDILLSSAPMVRHDLSKGVTFTAIDITQRKRIEKALKDSEQRYRSLFNNAPIGIGMSDLSGKVITANHVMEEVTGYTLSEFKKIKLSDTYVNPNERGKLIELLNNNGSVRNYEARLFRKDGTIYNARLNIDLLELGGNKVFLTIAQDITESKKMEEALRQEREQLLSIFDSIDQMVYVADTTTHEIIYMNKKLKKIFKSDGIGEPCYKILHQADAPCSFCTNKIIMENKYQPYQWEHYNTVMQKNFLLTDRLIQWPDGRDVRFEIAIDITESKKAQAEIIKLNKELEQRVKDRTSELEAVNKELEAFSYSVSHDLRAPLRHISGFVDLLFKNLGEKLDDKNGHFLEVVRQSANRMGLLIDELLDFSRTGRSEIAKKNFDCNKLIREVLQEIEHETGGRDIEWRISDMPEIYADQLKIRHVFINLLSNSIKFTRLEKKPIIEVKAIDGENNDFVFSVRDNGVGFDMKYVGKLFGVFQRLHRSEEFEGNGIGLANVRRIIHRHGGRTWAEGKLNEGATFYFSLPK